VTVSQTQTGLVKGWYGVEGARCERRDWVPSLCHLTYESKSHVSELCISKEGQLGNVLAEVITQLVAQLEECKEVHRAQAQDSECGVDLHVVCRG
jgi:hypothetical protein